MSNADPIEPGQPAPPGEPAEGTERGRPDWLMGAMEAAQTPPSGKPLAEPVRLRRAAPEAKEKKKEKEKKPAKASPPAGDTAAPAGATEEVAAPARAPEWKAGASSVPKLTQAPAVPVAPVRQQDSFPGFAQDAIEARKGAPSRRPPAEAKLPKALPLDDAALASDAEVAATVGSPWPARVPWRTAGIVAGVVVALAVAATTLRSTAGGGGGGASLREIRQHPEAFEGQQVVLAGTAGPSFPVAGRYVFDLYQGRDTIVVWTAGRPNLHEKVKVGGTLSVGYVDGVPRLALLESPASTEPAKPQHR